MVLPRNGSWFLVYLMNLHQLQWLSSVELEKRIIKVS
jgi:hypothetical protein